MSSLYKIMLVIFTFLCQTNAIIINPNGPTVISDYTKCIRNIINKDFNKAGLIIFSNTNNVSTSVLRIRNELLKTINTEIKYSVGILSPEKEVKACDEDNDKLGVLHVDVYIAIPYADYFIIIIDTYNDFSYLAGRLLRSRSWNPNAKFIISMPNFINSDKTNIEDAESILTCLFKYNVINIIIILPQEKNYRTAIIYSWKPYDPPKFCGHLNETAKNRLIEENVCNRGVLKYNKKVFQNKIPRDMSGCVLNVLALQRQPYISNDEKDANIEKVLLNRILKRFNMTAKYELLDGFRGEREGLGEWNGGLKKLASNKGKILLGGIFPDFDVHEDFECSVTYLADSYTWVVPRAPKLAPWVSLLIIFQMFVWYSAVAGFVICAVSWRIIGQLSGDSPYNKAISHCFLNTWISIFGFVAYKRPVKESLKVFFVFLNLYSVLFVTAYQTKLFDTLTNPSYEYQIQTVEELVDSGLHFGGFEEVHDLFYNSSDPFDYSIGVLWIDVDNMTEAMINVAVHRNFSVLCSRLELAHLSAVLPELSDHHGNHKYYAFEGNMFSVPIEMVGLRGFPFMEEFSNTINLFRQSGLNEEIRKNYAIFSNRRKAGLLRFLKRTNQNNDVDPLSLQHLQGGFFALAIGYVGGTVSLIIEIIMNTKYVQRKMSQCKKST